MNRFHFPIGVLLGVALMLGLNVYAQTDGTSANVPIPVEVPTVTDRYALDIMASTSLDALEALKLGVQEHSSDRIVSKLDEIFLILRKIEENTRN